MPTYWFIASQKQQGTKLAFFAFILAFIVILLGAYTRLTDAGLSCPDWPNCFGYLTAPHTHAQLESAKRHYPGTSIDVKKAWTEMTHRYFAGTEGLLILLLAWKLLSKRHIEGHKNIFLAVTLLSLLGVQVLLGMLTVTALLKPMIVLGHLLTGISIASVIWWVYLRSKTRRIYGTHPSIYYPWFCVAFIIVFMQIALGGWVSTHYAGLACIDLPYCNGQLIPKIQLGSFNNDLITIHMLHRFGALITTVYLSIFAFALQKNPAFRIAAFLIASLLMIQVSLGILNILWLRPVWIALAHHGIAIALFIVIITYMLKASHNGSP